VTVTGVITIFVDFVLPTIGSGFKDLNVSLVSPQVQRLCPKYNFSIAIGRFGVPA